MTQTCRIRFCLIEFYPACGFTIPEIQESGVLFPVLGWCHAKFFPELFGEITCGFKTAHQDDVPDCISRVSQKELGMDQF